MFTQWILFLLRPSHIKVKCTCFCLVYAQDYVGKLKRMVPIFRTEEYNEFNP